MRSAAVAVGVATGALFFFVGVGDAVGLGVEVADVGGLLDAAPVGVLDGVVEGAGVRVSTGAAVVGVRADPGVPVSEAAVGCTDADPTEDAAAWMQNAIAAADTTANSGAENRRAALTASMAQLLPGRRQHAPCCGPTASPSADDVRVGTSSQQDNGRRHDPRASEQPSPGDVGWPVRPKEDSRQPDRCNH